MRILGKHGPCDGIDRREMRRGTKLDRSNYLTGRQVLLTLIYRRGLNRKMISCDSSGIVTKLEMIKNI